MKKVYLLSQFMKLMGIVVSLSLISIVIYGFVHIYNYKTCKEKVQAELLVLSANGTKDYPGIAEIDHNDRVKLFNAYKEVNMRVIDSIEECNIAQKQSDFLGYLAF